MESFRKGMERLDVKYANVFNTRDGGQEIDNCQSQFKGGREESNANVEDC